MAKRPNTAARIKRMMRAHKVSQRKIAPMLGCSQTYVSLLLSKQRAGFINDRIELKLAELEAGIHEPQG